ncbi:MAG: hypothetical protein ACLVKO_11675 [Dysgonomonas sp.]
MRNLYLILLLIIPFFITNCDDDNEDPDTSEWLGDWNNPTDPNYKPNGYNPIVGEWLVTNINGNPATSFLAHRFSSDFLWGQSTTRPEAGKDPVYTDNGKYIVNNKQFRREDNEQIFWYVVDAAGQAMTIRYGSNKYVLRKYTRSDEWNGDWNNPTDPNYKPNGYNPISGDWLVNSINDIEYDGFQVYRFSNDRNWGTATEKPELGKDFVFRNKRDYIINDKAFRTTSENLIYKYEFVKGLSGVERLRITEAWGTVIVLTPYNTNAWKNWNGDWNNPADPNYKPNGYNPIEGNWFVTNRNNFVNIGEIPDLETLFYAHDRKLTQKLEANLGQSFLSSETFDYIINDKAYMINNKVYAYKLESNKLSITDENNTTTVLESYDGWKWNGDWNDPTDPNYKPDGYSPVTGIWKFESGSAWKDEYPTWYFNPDLTFVRSKPNSNAKPGEPNEIQTTPIPYLINDKSIRLLINGKYAFYDYQIVSEGIDKMILTPRYPSSSSEKIIKMYSIDR